MGLAVGVEVGVPVLLAVGVTVGAAVGAVVTIGVDAGNVRVPLTTHVAFLQDFVDRVDESIRL